MYSLDDLDSKAYICFENTISALELEKMLDSLFNEQRLNLDLLNDLVSKFEILYSIPHFKFFNPKLEILRKTIQKDWLSFLIAINELKSLRSVSEGTILVLRENELIADVDLELHPEFKIIDTVFDSAEQLSESTIEFVSTYRNHQSTLNSNTHIYFDGKAFYHNGNKVYGVKSPNKQKLLSAMWEYRHSPNEGKQGSYFSEEKWYKAAKIKNPKEVMKDTKSYLNRDSKLPVVIELKEENKENVYRLVVLDKPHDSITV